MPYPERLTVLDDMFLHLEGPSTPMNVGAVALLRGPAPRLQELRAAIAGRLGASERLRQRVATVPFGLHRPVWVDDPSFAIERHVVETPSRGPLDRRALNAIVAATMSTRLDRAHPLWELRLVDGLPETRWALILRAHHCMVDGASGVALLQTLLAEIGRASCRERV
jgi:diacylglycerol O-acyltransferase